MNKLNIFLKSLISLVLLLGIISFQTELVYAENIEISGKVASSVSYNNLYYDSLLADPINHSNLLTSLTGDLYFQYINEDQFQYFLDLKFDGSLVNTQTSIAPVNLLVNQLYIIIPFSDNVFLSVGKKYKEIGVSSSFNISNRISPKFYNYSSYSYSENVPGIIEVDILKSSAFSYGFIMNFKNAQNWDDIQASVFTNYNSGNFNIEEYLYFEKFQDYFIGSNLTYQLGKYQLYTESIVKGRAEQKVITQDTGNPTNDFQVQNLRNSIGIVFGGSISINNTIASLEYMYNGEGYDGIEQAVFINYFQKYPALLSQINSFYSRCAFAKNYLAFNISTADFFHQDLTLKISTIASFPPGTDNFGDYASYELIGGLEYSFKQNVVLKSYLSYRTGGAKSEFQNFYPNNLGCFLSINYTF